MDKFIKNHHFLAVCIGVVYLWFGLLKFFPNLSPAEHLAVDTMRVLTFQLIPSSLLIVFLAIMEVTIGLLLISNLFKKIVTGLALGHIVLTFTPFLFFPELSFSSPFIPTLLGQYIGKNIIIVGALTTLVYNNLMLDKAPK